MAEEALVRHIAHKRAAKALELKWAWFELSINDDEWRRVLIRPTAVSEESPDRQTSHNVILRYMLEAVDHEGTMYTIAMERDVSRQPHHDAVILQPAPQQLPDVRVAGDADLFGGIPRSFAAITRRPAPKPRVRKS